LEDDSEKLNRKCIIYLDSSKGYENYEWYKLSFQRSGRDRASADKPKIQVRGLFEIPQVE
jgi:hypothetical protein